MQFLAGLLAGTIFRMSFKEKLPVNQFIIVDPLGQRHQVTEWQEFEVSPSPAGQKRIPGAKTLVTDRGENVNMTDWDSGECEIVTAAGPVPAQRDWTTREL